LSYRDVDELLAERGICVDHTDEPGRHCLWIAFDALAAVL
jgi:hypothetical protein